eukprot:2635999-Alexandrium_andersonii.AAC.1
MRPPFPAEGLPPNQGFEHEREKGLAEGVPNSLRDPGRYEVWPAGLERVTAEHGRPDGADVGQLDSRNSLAVARPTAEGLQGTLVMGDEELDGVGNVPGNFGTKISPSAPNAIPITSE